MKQLTILFILLFLNHLTFSQTSLFGKISDKENGEDLIGANVVVEQNGVFIIGTCTDFNGIYQIKLSRGTYDVKVISLGYPENLIKNVTISKRQETILNIPMDSSPDLDLIVIKKYNSKIQSADKFFCWYIYPSILKPLPSQTITLITTASLECKFIDVDHENTMKWIWSKSFYLDGIRLDGNVSNISYFDVEQIQVFSGGVPAAFDDSCDSVFALLP